MEEGASRSERWAEETLRAGRAAELELRGTSMRPALREGDWLVVEPLDRLPSPGEIVVARWGGRLVTHRLVWAGDGWAVTRGDACRSGDPALPVGALLGRVTAVRRGARRLSPPVRGGRLRRWLARW